MGGFQNQPTSQMELEVQWPELDLDEYSMSVLTCEGTMRGAPWEYIEKCEETLTEYENRSGDFLMRGVPHQFTPGYKLGIRNTR
jgi:hypothetical protein